MAGAIATGVPLGAAAFAEAQFRTLGRTGKDPTTVMFTVEPPSGDPVDYTVPDDAIEHLGDGWYRLTWIVDQTGEWTVTTTSTGDVAATGVATVVVVG